MLSQFDFPALSWLWWLFHHLAMPPKGKPGKPATNKMDPAAAALKTPSTGSTARPALVTAVPSKSARTLFAEEDPESRTLSAKLAALRIEQAAGGKAGNGKGKDGDFKDAVSDTEEEVAAEDVAGESSSGAARHFCILDDEDDGLIAHYPKECFEDKAKEVLAAKLRFPLTLLISSDHLQEVRRTQATVKELLGTAWAAATVATATSRMFLKDPALVLVSTSGNREEWVCLLECCEKGKGTSFEQAAHHAMSQRHLEGLAKQGAATRALKANLSLRVLRKEYGIQ
ncbi:unnamed protein product [Closterium sp. Naga37s-1]|nr:unnamed protein product [Closterium sp. Naga37s-1]